MLLVLKDDNTSGSLYLYCLLYVLSVIMKSEYICTSVYFCIITLCVDGMIMNICMCLLSVAICVVCYWFTVFMCQTPIRLVHGGPTVIDILPRPANVKYLTLTGVIPECHNLKHEKISTYLTSFACLIGRIRYARLLFRVTPASNMFQRKKNKIFKDLLNVFGISDNTPVVRYDNDGANDDRTIREVPKLCRKILN